LEELADSEQQKLDIDEQRVVTSEGLEAVGRILAYARTDDDRKNWLKLMCQDIILTTVQAQEMIQNLTESKIIGPGGSVTPVTIVEYLWINIIDDENKFDFLYQNSSVRERRDMANSLTFQVFKFNKRNPTSHWRIDFSNKIQRALFLQLVDINTDESYFSHYHSERGDTSQKGNWYNFRNERFNSVTYNEMVIDDPFLSDIPTEGFLEFDYVSTNRPNPSDFEDEDDSVMSSPTEQVATSPLSPNNIEVTPFSPKKRTSNKKSSISNKDTAILSVDQPLEFNNGHEYTKDHHENESNQNYRNEISDSEFNYLMIQLGLNSRKKLDSTTLLYTLLELQLAAAKYYFPVSKVLQLILTSFSQEESTIKAKVVICLINRISDLHNFDMIMRLFKTAAQNEIIFRVGWLNIFNPLKPAFNYNVNLRDWDNRMLVLMLLQMGDMESSDELGEQLKEDTKTEVTLYSLEENLNELQKKNVERDDNVIFSYGEIAERTLVVSWETRKEMLKKCLLGTRLYEDDEEEQEYRKKGKLDGNNIYDVITWYNELESNNSFSSGPLDLQFATYFKYGFVKDSNINHSRSNESSHVFD